MEKYRQWETDTQYRALIDDLLATPEVQHLADFTQHHSVPAWSTPFVCLIPAT